MIILGCFGGTTILGNTHIWRVYGAVSPNPPPFSVDGSWTPSGLWCGALLVSHVGVPACYIQDNDAQAEEMRLQVVQWSQLFVQGCSQKPWPWRGRLFSLSLRMNHCGITPSNLLGADFSGSCANLAPTVHPGVLAAWQNCTALLSKCFSTSVWWRAL